MRIKLNKWRGQRGWTALLTAGKAVVAKKAKDKLSGATNGLVAGGSDGMSATGSDPLLTPTKGAAQPAMDEPAGLFGAKGSEPMPDTGFIDGLMAEAPQGAAAPQIQQGFSLDSFVKNLKEQNNGMGLQADLPQFDWSQLWQ